MFYGKVFNYENICIQLGFGMCLDGKKNKCLLKVPKSQNFLSIIQCTFTCTCIILTYKLCVKTTYSQPYHTADYFC